MSDSGSRSGSAVDTRDSSRTRERRSRGQITRRIVSAVVVIAVVIGGISAVQWWRHPTVFESGLGTDFTADPQPLARAVEYVSVAVPPYETDHRERLTITGAHANYRYNSDTSLTPDSIRSTFQICSYQAGSEQTMSGPQPFCDHVRPLRKGSAFSVAPRGIEQIVLVIHPLRRGSVTLTSVDLTYRRSWKHLHQHGTQRVPIYYKLTAS